jgi:hypothetical protein
MIGTHPITAASADARIFHNRSASSQFAGGREANQRPLSVRLFFQRREGYCADCCQYDRHEGNSQV